jgi:hypothetical protein
MGECQYCVNGSTLESEWTTESCSNLGLLTVVKKFYILANFQQKNTVFCVMMLCGVV